MLASWGAASAVPASTIEPASGVGVTGALSGVSPASSGSTMAASLPAGRQHTRRTLPQRVGFCCNSGQVGASDGAQVPPIDVQDAVLASSSPASLPASSRDPEDLLLHATSAASARAQIGSGEAKRIAAVYRVCLAARAEEPRPFRAL